MMEVQMVFEVSNEGSLNCEGLVNARKFDLIDF